MTGLTWFQARALAKLQKRPIRRAGWEKWMLWRSSLWLMEDGTPRHVVTDAEFGEGEFLAKDWTDETWAGGSYPPCTTPGGSTALAPSDTGGLGAWTTTGACGGAGDGGGVIAAGGVAETPPTGLSMYLYALPLRLEGETGVYSPALTEPSPIEIRASDGFLGEGDEWDFGGYIFIHYTVTGSADGDTEIVGLWTFHDYTSLDEANLANASTFDSGAWVDTLGYNFWGHTITSHGRSSWYYMGTPAAVAGETYPAGGRGFTAAAERSQIDVMLAQRHADGTITNVVRGSYTLPPFSGEVRWWNEEQSYEATCAEGTHGDAVTRTVAALTYSSSVSLAAANATALSVATAAANADLACTPDYPNEEQTATCAEGTHGTPVTIAAGTYTSPISVADANATALAAAEAALVCEPD